MDILTRLYQALEGQTGVVRVEAVDKYARKFDESKVKRDADGQFAASAASAAKAAVVEHANSEHFDMPVGKLHAKLKAEHPEITNQQFKELLVAMHEKGEIRLSRWAGPLADMPNKDLAIPEPMVTGHPGLVAGRTDYYYYARPGEAAKKYAAEPEDAAVGNLYLHSYPSESAAQLATVADWQDFASWAIGQGGELRRLAVYGHTDDCGDGAVQRLADQLAAADVPERYAAVANAILDAAVAGGEGLVVSEEE